MKTHSLVELVAQHAFFAGLRAEDVEFIAGCGKNVVFQEDETIARQGSPADCFYILRTGRVAIEALAPQRAAMIIETLGANEILGASWIVPPYRWRFDARAVELTRAVAMDGRCLRAKCEDDTRLGYELMKRFSSILGDRLNAARLRALDVYGVAEPESGG